MHKCKRFVSGAIAVAMAMAVTMTSVSATEFVSDVVTEEAVAEEVVAEEAVTEEANVEDSDVETPVVEEVSAEEVEEAVAEETDDEALAEESADTEISLAQLEANAIGLTLNTAKMTDKLLVAGETGAIWYKFTITSPGYVWIEGGPGTGADSSQIKYGWNYAIYSKDNLSSPIKEMVGVTAATQSEKYILAKDTYYVCVQSRYSGTSDAPINQPFKIKVGYKADSNVVMEKNDASNTASPINVNNKYYGSMLTGDDVDWYKFTLPKNGCVKLDFGASDLADIAKLNYGWNIEIIDSSFSSIREYSGVKNNISSGYSTDILPFKAGVYYLKVTSRYTSSYDAPIDQLYKLNVVFTTPANWESESNDSNSTANTIATNTNVEGLLYKGADIDWYKFSVSKKTRASLSFALAPEANVDHVKYGWNMQLYNASMESVQENTGIKTNKTFDDLDLNPGTYYIKVCGRYANNYDTPIGCPYLIKVNAKDMDPRKPLPKGEKFAEYQGYKFYKDKSNNNCVTCFDASGNIVINDFKCDGTYTYYFQLDGSAMKDRLTYHPDGIHVIYFDENGHEVFSDFHKISKSIAGDTVDDLCFFDVFGYMYVDVMTYDKSGTEMYYINPYGVMERNGWFGFSDTCKWAGTNNLVGPGIGYAYSSGSLKRNSYTTSPMGRCYLQADGHALFY